MRFFSKTYSWEFGDKKIKFPVPTKHYAIAHFPAYCKNLCVWGISKRVCRERTLPPPKSSVTVSLGRQQWIASFLFDCSIMLDVLLFNFFSLYLFPFYCHPEVSVASDKHSACMSCASHLAVFSKSPPLLHVSVLCLVTGARHFIPKCSKEENRYHKPYWLCTTPSRDHCHRLWRERICSPTSLLGLLARFILPSEFIFPLPHCT